MCEPASDAAGMDAAGMGAADPFSLMVQLITACMSCFSVQEELLPAATVPLSSSWSQSERQTRESRVVVQPQANITPHTHEDVRSSSVESCCSCPSWCTAWCTSSTTTVQPPEENEIQSYTVHNDDEQDTSEQCIAPPPTPEPHGTSTHFEHGSYQSPKSEYYVYYLNHTQDKNIKLIIIPHEAHNLERNNTRRGAMCAIRLRTDENRTSRAASIDES